MKKARVKRKRKLKISRVLILLLILTTSIIITIKNLSFKNINVNDEEYLSTILTTSYSNNNPYEFIVKKITKIFLNIDLNKPETFLTFNKIKNSSKQISKIKEKYNKEDDYKKEDYEDKTSYITVKSDVKDPIVYIYNTHQLETYSSDNLLDGITPNVMMAGSLLAERLNKNGIKTIFEDTNLSDFISKMGLPSNELYGGSRVFISNAKEKYKSLKYFIDIHRDSIEKDISTINIDNKEYARVLFVLGITNKNYEQNKVMMSKLDEIINSKYPKLSRGIYEVDIDDWPEIYNQDLDKNVILIELGAKDNDINEVLNTIDVLEEAIKTYIKEDK